MGPSITPLTNLRVYTVQQVGCSHAECYEYKCGEKVVFKRGKTFICIIVFPYW